MWEGVGITNLSRKTMFLYIIECTGNFIPKGLEHPPPLKVGQLLLDILTIIIVEANRK